MVVMMEEKTKVVKKPSVKYNRKESGKELFMVPNAIRLRPRRIGTLLSLALVFFLGSGCGLRDYEDHIDRQKLRIKVFDEESQVLGDPLDAPLKDGVPLAPVGFFLRPPKSLAKTWGGQAYTVNQLSLYWYG